MKKCIIWHNPKCRKSRETLQLLQAGGLVPEIREYLKDVPSTAEIKAALNKLGLPARSLLRTKETPYKDLGLADKALADTALIRAMATHPILIERPVVFFQEKAILGRPPENVKKIL